MNEELTWMILGNIVPITARNPMGMENTVEWIPKTLSDFGSWLAYFEQALLGNGFERGKVSDPNYFVYHSLHGSVHMRVRCMQNHFWIRATYYKA